MKRFLYWWYAITWLPAAIIGGDIAGPTGAGFGLCGALLVNGALIAAYEYRYPPTNIP